MFWGDMSSEEMWGEWPGRMPSDPRSVRVCCPGWSRFDRFKRGRLRRIGLKGEG